MKKKYLILIFAFFLLSGCAKILGDALDAEPNEFQLTLVAAGDGKIKVVIPREDHTRRKTLASGDGTYFRGYYIFRSPESPYEQYSQIGVDAFPDDSGDAVFLEKNLGNPAGAAETWTPGTTPYFVDDCPDNSLFYYRVVVVYQKYNGGWDSELKDESRSAWKGALCASNLLGNP